MARRLTLTQLLALVAGGPALVVTAAVIVGIFTITHQNRVQDLLLRHVQPANATSLRLQIAMLNQETGIRGFELTGEQPFLQPYRDGVQQARMYTTLLRGYAATLPDAVSDLSVALTRIRDWEAHTARPAILHAQASRPGSSGTIDRNAAGEARFDAIRAALDKLQALLKHKVTATKADLASAARTTTIAFIVIGVVLLLAVVIGAWLLSRYVTRPIGALAGGARRVAGGDLGYHLALDGPRDLEEMAQDVDAMRQRLFAELNTSQAMQHQLEIAAEDLQRSNTELEQFAYVASHDLQEPLRKVTSFCQLLQSRYADKLDDRADQYIGFAVDGAKRMQQLINDLLAFSRVGRTDQAYDDVSLFDLADAARADLANAIEDAGAEVRIGELPTLRVEPTLIRTVFQNLLGNAIKFRGEAAPRVDFDASRDGDFWEFSCSDNGIGIEPEYAERIFVIFQRLHTREAYPGTGIGLAMCRKIIEHHGGRMWLDQSSTGGTRMCFTLPVSPPPPNSGSAEA